MKSEKQIADMRAALGRRLARPHLSDIQKATLFGMLNAIVWVADGKHSSTMDMILSDEPISTEQPNG